MWNSKIIILVEVKIDKWVICLDIVWPSYDHINIIYSRCDANVFSLDKRMRQGNTYTVRHAVTSFEASHCFRAYLIRTTTNLSYFSPTHRKSALIYTRQCTEHNTIKTTTIYMNNNRSRHETLQPLYCMVK
jgi:hypothetical protein